MYSTMKTGKGVVPEKASHMTRIRYVICPFMITTTTAGLSSLSSLSRNIFYSTTTAGIAASEAAHPTKITVVPLK